MKNILLITALIIITYNCKPHEIKPPEDLTLDEILPKYQWRKTEKAIYNTNNELEENLFTFEDAEDCEKNTYWIFHGEVRYYDFCTDDFWHPYQYTIKNDSLSVYPYEKDTVPTLHFKKHINYYDNKTFVLDYDTIINEANKKIKETFTAFPKN